MCTLHQRTSLLSCFASVAFTYRLLLVPVYCPQTTCSNTSMEAQNRSSRLNKTLYGLPVHCLTQADLELENARGLRDHFHAPENRHNRFMSSITDIDKGGCLREVERPIQYSNKFKPGCIGAREVVYITLCVVGAVLFAVHSRCPCS